MRRPTCGTPRAVAARGPARRRSVFHFAAQVAVTTSLDPAGWKTSRSTPAGTLNVLEAIRAESAPAAAPASPRPTRCTAASATCRSVQRPAATSPRIAQLRACRRLRGRAARFPQPLRLLQGARPTSTSSTMRAPSALPAAVFRMSCIYGPRQFGTEDQGWVAAFPDAGAPAASRSPSTATGCRCGTCSSSTTSSTRSSSRRRRPPADLGRGVQRRRGPGEHPQPARAARPHRGARRQAPVEVGFEEWRPGDQRYYVSDHRRLLRAPRGGGRASGSARVRRLHGWLREMTEAPGAGKAAAGAGQPAKEPCAGGVL